MSRNICLLLALSAVLGALSFGISHPDWLPRLETNSADSLGENGKTTDTSSAATPSAATESAPLPPVRVLLGSKAQATHRLRIDGPYRVRVQGDWRVLAQGDRLEECDATVNNATANDTNGNSAGLRVGNNEFNHRRLQIDVLKSGTLWVNSHRYHGSLQLIADSNDQLRAIGLVDIESYVASVVNGEMPADFPTASRRAQAIAARTYTVYHMKSGGRDPEFDLYDNTRSQAYGGIEYIDTEGRRLAVETPSSRKIADDTAGLVLLYEGRVINSYYSAVCGGHTANGPAIFSDAAPPLIGVKCDGCVDAPRYRWSVDMPRADMHDRLAAYLDRIGRHVGDITSVSATDAMDGHLPQVDIRGTKSRHRITTAALRRHVLKTGDLPSAFFSVSEQKGVTEQDGLVRCQGRGWGHGVGLCQWGARGLGQQGRTSVEILSHYYPGCQLRPVR